jgi:hypothetical protein
MSAVAWEPGGDEALTIDRHVSHHYAGIIANENALPDGGDLIVLPLVMPAMAHGRKHCENFKGNGSLRVVDTEVGIKALGFCSNSSVARCCNRQQTQKREDNA